MNGLNKNGTRYITFFTTALFLLTGRKNTRMLIGLRLVGMIWNLQQKPKCKLFLPTRNCQTKPCLKLWELQGVTLNWLQGGALTATGWAYVYKSIQDAADAVDVKRMYEGIKKATGPPTLKVNPLPPSPPKSKDCQNNLWPIKATRTLGRTLPRALCDPKRGIKVCVKFQRLMVQ